MKKSAFILIIDSYLVRKGMASILNKIPGVMILQEFSELRPLEAFLKNHAYDFMIIGQSLFEASAPLFNQDPLLLEKTILLREDPPGQEPAEDPGLPVCASMHLKEDRDHIVKLIRDLLNQVPGNNDVPVHMELSPRETTILRLVSLGLTNRQIADRLFLSAHTVMTHRKNISSKLGIKSVSGLTVYAIVNNIITIEEVTSLPEQ